MGDDARGARARPANGPDCPPGRSKRLDWQPEDHYTCDTNLVHAAMAGWNPLGQNVWDLRRCLDVLEQHELVDPARIGMVGVSYGGTVTLFNPACESVFSNKAAEIIGDAVRRPVLGGEQDQYPPKRRRKTVGSVGGGITQGDGSIVDFSIEIKGKEVDHARTDR